MLLIPRKCVFWDVDTQRDFILPDGKLPVPNGTEILPNLKKLTSLARSAGIPIVMSMDTHLETDPEISQSPDYIDTFPPHCLIGSKGWEKVSETAPENPIRVKPAPVKGLDEKLKEHKGEIVIEKSLFDVFSNPNTERILAFLDPDLVVVYGVTTEVCCRYAVEGLLHRGRKPLVVKDAVKPIRPEKQETFLRGWELRGVGLIDTRYLEKTLS